MVIAGPDVALCRRVSASVGHAWTHTPHAVQPRADMAAAGLDVWSVDASTVRLRVVVPTPSILPRSLGHRVAFGQIDRTFAVHVEELR